jgi:hypothetical protein
MDCLEVGSALPTKAPFALSIKPHQKWIGLYLSLIFSFSFSSYTNPLFFLDTIPASATIPPSNFSLPLPSQKKTDNRGKKEKTGIVRKCDH